MNSSRTSTARGNFSSSSTTTQSFSPSLVAKSAAASPKENALTRWQDSDNAHMRRENGLTGERHSKHIPNEEGVLTTNSVPDDAGQRSVYARSPTPAPLLSSSSTPSPSASLGNSSALVLCSSSGGLSVLLSSPRYPTKAEVVAGAAVSSAHHNGIGNSLAGSSAAPGAQQHYRGTPHILGGERRDDDRSSLRAVVPYTRCTSSGAVGFLLEDEPDAYDSEFDDSPALGMGELVPPLRAKLGNEGHGGRRGAQKPHSFSSGRRSSQSIVHDITRSDQPIDSFPTLQIAGLTRSSALSKGEDEHGHSDITDRTTTHEPSCGKTPNARSPSRDRSSSVVVSEASPSPSSCSIVLREESGDEYRQEEEADHFGKHFSSNNNKNGSQPNSFRSSFSPPRPRESLSEAYRARRGEPNKASMLRMDSTQPTGEEGTHAKGRNSQKRYASRSEETNASSRHVQVGGRDLGTAAHLEERRRQLQLLVTRDLPDQHAKAMRKVEEREGVLGALTLRARQVGEKAKSGEEAEHATIMRNVLALANSRRETGTLRSEEKALVEELRSLENKSRMRNETYDRSTRVIEAELAAVALAAKRGLRADVSAKSEWLGSSSSGRVSDDSARASFEEELPTLMSEIIKCTRLLQRHAQAMEKAAEDSRRAAAHLADRRQGSSTSFPRSGDSPDTSTLGDPASNLEEAERRLVEEKTAVASLMTTRDRLLTRYLSASRRGDKLEAMVSEGSFDSAEEKYPPRSTPPRLSRQPPRPKGPDLVETAVSGASHSLNDSFQDPQSARARGGAKFTLGFAQEKHGQTTSFTPKVSDTATRGGQRFFVSFDNSSQEATSSEGGHDRGHVMSIKESAEGKSREIRDQVVRRARSTRRQEGGAPHAIGRKDEGLEFLSPNISPPRSMSAHFSAAGHASPVPNPRGEGRQSVGIEGAGRRRRSGIEEKGAHGLMNVLAPSDDGSFLNITAVHGHVSRRKFLDPLSASPRLPSWAVGPASSLPRGGSEGGRGSESQGMKSSGLTQHDRGQMKYSEDDCPSAHNVGSRSPRRRSPFTNFSRGKAANHVIAEVGNSRELRDLVFEHVDGTSVSARVHGGANDDRADGGSLPHFFKNPPPFVDPNRFAVDVKCARHYFSGDGMEEEGPEAAASPPTTTYRASFSAPKRSGSGEKVHSSGQPEDTAVRNRDEAEELTYASYHQRPSLGLPRPTRGDDPRTSREMLKGKPVFRL